MQQKVPGYPMPGFRYKKTHTSLMQSDKRANPSIFYFIFVFSELQLTDCRFKILYCLCWDSNHGSMVSEATALPSVPQPMPSLMHLYSCHRNYRWMWEKMLQRYFDWQHYSVAPLFVFQVDSGDSSPGSGKIPYCFPYRADYKEGIGRILVTKGARCVYT